VTELSIRIHMFVTSAIASFIEDIKRDDGQDLIEYALFGGLLATIIIAIAAIMIATPALNPVKTLLSGLSGCVDFNTTTPCKPF
jgi:hypothetical protein